MKVSKAVSNPLGSAWFVVLVESTHNTLFELIDIFSFAKKVSLALSKQMLKIWFQAKKTGVLDITAAVWIYNNRVIKEVILFVDGIEILSPASNNLPTSVIIYTNTIRT